MWKLLAVLLVTSCGAEGTGKGNLQVFIVPEESIAAGVAAGVGAENIQDGWTVTYTRFLVTVGNFRARSSAGAAAPIEDRTVYVLDLRKAPASGYVTLDRRDLAAVRYDKVGEDMPVARAGARVLAPTTDADLKLMIDNGYSLYIEGRMSKADGMSCTPGKPTECVAAKEIVFKWGFAMGTSFDDCASAQGDTGFAVPQGGTIQAKPTIHGDHWFFANITQGAELTKRYAQYIADCDLDHNGETTLDELSRVRSSDVFPADKYRLSGGLGGPIMTAFDYVKAQARTIHDFQGDGECPTRAILQ